MGPPFLFTRAGDTLKVQIPRKAGRAYLRKLYGKLRLKVKEAKSAVGLAAGRQLLGNSTDGFGTECGNSA